MRCHLNVILLKAVLLFHEAVALLEDQLSRGYSDSNTLDAVMTKLALQQWKLNQVMSLH